MENYPVYIIDGIRTPTGQMGGALKDVTAHALGVHLVKEFIKRYPELTSKVNEVIFGCVGQGSDAPNIARVIALQAGIDSQVPAYTVQRNCASGMQAIICAAKDILIGESEVVIAGGTESMSNIPFVNRKMRFGQKMGSVQLTDSLLEGLTDPIHGIHMGETAERLADKYGITRKEQDAFAAQSHARAFAATRQGKFKDELVPISVVKKMMGQKVGEEPITKDEGISPKPQSALSQELASYPTVFRKENGTVTPGNACPINDGASAVIMVSAKFYEANKSWLPEPLGKIMGWGAIGVDPTIMGIGPACVIPPMLKGMNLTLADVDLFEINEAFAAQYLAVEKELGLDREKVNVNGGAIALGHPVGSSGCRIIVTLLHEMKRQQKKRGVASLCVGGGQGVSVVVER